MKRIAELQSLSRDHHHGLVLARRARRVAAGKLGFSVSGAWSEVERRFRQDLEPHFTIEEKYLVPLLLGAGQTEMVKRLEEEHARLRGLVGDSVGPELARLAEFGRLLEEHIRFEERELFEFVQKHLPPSSLKGLEEACRGRNK